MIGLLILLLLTHLQINVAGVQVNVSKDSKIPLKTRILIIGGGPAGLSAAIGAGKAGTFNPIVVEGSVMEGAAIKAGEVNNYPGHIKISGAKLVQDMRKHAQTLGVKLLQEEKVTKCNFKSKPFRVETNKGNKIDCDSVIIATGTNPRKLGVPGEDKYSGKGVAYCSKCDGPLFRYKKVVIIGNDHSALRELGTLKNYTENITIVSTKDKFTAPQMLMNNLQMPNLKVVYNADPQEILGDCKVTGVKVKNHKGEMEVFPADGVFIAIGWKPSTDVFKGHLAINYKGEIVVDCEISQTSVPGVFACGDCSTLGKHQMPHAAGTGYTAYLNAENYLNKK